MNTCVCPCVLSYWLIYAWMHGYDVMWRDVTISLESSQSEWQRKCKKKTKMFLWQKGKLLFNIGQDWDARPWTLLPSMHLQNSEEKDIGIEWYLPGKNAYIHVEWLAAQKVIKCDISCNNAVQKSCRVTTKCQYSVNTTNLKWKTQSLNYFWNITEYPETGPIVTLDLHLRFAAVIITPLFTLSFSKFCILKAQKRKPTVWKYWQTINP